jgi:uncharacterized protein with PIN domain
VARGGQCRDGAQVARALRGVALDAGPVVSLLLDDPAAGDVAQELRHAGPLRISVVNVAEIVDVLRRVHRVSAAETSRAVDRFLDEVAQPVTASREQATLAADLRARHYHRRDRDLSLADCFVIAAARPGDAIATSDRAVAQVARAEGMDVLALPNPRGLRP